MVVYEEYKFAFQHVNRCGGTTVRKAIESLAGPADSCTTPPGAAHQLMKTRLRKLRSKEVDIDNFSIYANVRNPFHRVVSIYFFRVLTNRFKEISFKDFFYGYYWEKKTVASGPIHPMILVDEKVPDNLKIIKVEELNTFWPDIILRHFGKGVELNNLNQSDHNDPMSYYDKEMKSLVKQADWWVIENFYPELKTV